MGRALLLALLFTIRSTWAEPQGPSELQCNSSLERTITPFSGYYGSREPKESLTNISAIYEYLTRCHEVKSLSLVIYRSCGITIDELSNFNFSSDRQLPRLSKLALAGYPFGDFQRVGEQERPAIRQSNMKPILPGSPSVRTLPASQQIYVPGANIDAWKGAMDWTGLHSLELSDVDNIFFWKMRGALPALKNLTIGNNDARSDAKGYMTDFMTSLNPLTNLSTHGYTELIDWSQVFGHHGSSLERLDVLEWNSREPDQARQTLSTTDLKEMSRLCPMLSEIKLNLKMDDDIPYDDLEALASNERLTRLNIVLRGNKPKSPPKEDQNNSYNLVADLDPSEGDVEPHVPSFIDTQTVLQMFQFLRARKQGAELVDLKVEVGNYNTAQHQVPGWVDIWGSTLASKHVCSMLREDGTRKVEGEAWCHCKGSCQQTERWWRYGAH